MPFVMDKDRRKWLNDMTLELAARLSLTILVAFGRRGRETTYQYIYRCSFSAYNSWHGCRDEYAMC